MSPRLRPCFGGRREEDSHECERVAARGDIQPGAKQRAAVGGRSRDAGAELSAGETSVATLPSGRSDRPAASQCWSGIPPRQAPAFRAQGFGVLREKYSRGAREARVGPAVAGG